MNKAKKVSKNKRSKGNFAEQIAVNYLKRMDYKVLERNYQKRIGEIDIVSAQADTIVFVEVKSLTTESILALEQTISALKKHKLIKICQYWLSEHNKSNANWRIDFIGIVVDIYGELRKLKHLPNAIY